MIFDIYINYHIIKDSYSYPQNFGQMVDLGLKLCDFFLLLSVISMRRKFCFNTLTSSFPPPKKKRKKKAILAERTQLGGRKWGLGSGMSEVEVWRSEVRSENWGLEDTGIDSYHNHNISINIFYTSNYLPFPVLDFANSEVSSCSSGTPAVTEMLEVIQPRAWFNSF